MANNNILVKDTKIKTLNINGSDYISLTDIAKQKNESDPNGVISNWMETATLLNFLGYGKVCIIRILTPSNSRGLEKRQG